MNERERKTLREIERKIAREGVARTRYGERKGEKLETVKERKENEQKRE